MPINDSKVLNDKSSKKYQKEVFQGYFEINTIIYIIS